MKPNDTARLKKKMRSKSEDNLKYFVEGSFFSLGRSIWKTEFPSNRLDKVS